MDIYEFLYKFDNRIINHSEIYHNPCFIKIEPLIQVFDTLSRIDDFKLISIATNEVYPEHISLGKNEYIVWDETYWILFENMFFSYMCLDALYSNEDRVFIGGKSICSTENKEKQIQQLMSLYSYFIAIKLYKKDLRLATIFAMNYGMIQSETSSFYQITMDPLEFSSYIYYAKIFCLSHEITHFYCRRDSQFKNKQFDSIKKGLQYYKKATGFLSDETIFRSFGVKREIISECIEHVMNNDELLEEIVCDVEAYIFLGEFINTPTFDKQIFGPQEIMVLRIHNFLNFFNCMLSLLDDFWVRATQNYYHAAGKNNESFYKQVCKYNFPMIIYCLIILQKNSELNISDLEKLHGGINPIFPNIDNTFLIEKNIYNNFLTEQRREYFHSYRDKAFPKDITEKELKSLFFNSIGWRNIGGCI